MKRSRRKKRIIGSIFGAIVLVAIFFSVILLNDSFKDFLGGAVNDDRDAGVNPGDASLLVQTDRYQNAAEAYKSKVFNYDGLCKSVGLDQEQFHCSENIEQYAIGTQLSTGEYYCVDSTGFADFVNAARNGDVACKKE